MKNILISAIAVTAALMPTQAIAQTVRLDFFGYGYMEVEEGRVNNWLSGISSAITNSAKPQDFPTTQPLTDLPTLYGFNCDYFYNQQEAQFHYMNGSGSLDLDRDRDGIACEHLTDLPRIDGSLVTATSTLTGRANIMASNGGYYLWVEYTTIGGIELEGISTLLFETIEQAREHYETYYEGT